MVLSKTKILTYKPTNISEKETWLYGPYLLKILTSCPVIVHSTTLELNFGWDQSPFPCMGSSAGPTPVESLRGEQFF